MTIRRFLQFDHQMHVSPDDRRRLRLEIPGGSEVQSVTTLEERSPTWMVNADGL